MFCLPTSREWYVTRLVSNVVQTYQIKQGCLETVIDAFMSHISVAGIRCTKLVVVQGVVVCVLVLANGGVNL